MKYGTFWILLLAACGADAPAGDPIEPPSSESSSAPLTKPCSSCRRRGGPEHLCSKTRWCASCGRDAGMLHHRCGRTRFCATCSREAGTGHVCGLTRLCSTRTCRGDGKVFEAGPHHVCGRTRVCTNCRADAARDGHSCRNRTRFCPRCRLEVTAAHVCNASFYCADERCATERLLDHDHGRKARFCPTCRTEASYLHRH